MLIVTPTQRELLNARRERLARMNSAAAAFNKRKASMENPPANNIECAAVVPEPVKTLLSEEPVYIPQFLDLRLEAPTITADRVCRAVCHHFKIGMNDLKSERRATSLVRARWVAMHIIKDNFGYSYPKIGRIFGGRDHTTVMHGIERIGALLAEGDDEMTTAVKSVSNALGIA